MGPLGPDEGGGTAAVAAAGSAGLMTCAGRGGRAKGKGTGTDMTGMTGIGKGRRVPGAGGRPRPGMGTGVDMGARKLGALGALGAAPPGSGRGRGRTAGRDGIRPPASVGGFIKPKLRVPPTAPPPLIGGGMLIPLVAPGGGSGMRVGRGNVLLPASESDMSCGIVFCCVVCESWEWSSTAGTEASETCSS